MKIALIGYGKMGKEVEHVSIERGHEIVRTFDIGDIVDSVSLRETKANVVIDFTQPDAVLSNARSVLGAGIPLVIGTTGWEKDRVAIEVLVTESGLGCVTASNFSIGVNLFMEIVKHAARLLDGAGYDAYLTEAHHRMKKDFPSGTALKLAELVQTGMKSKKTISSVLPVGAPIPSDALNISSVRAGTITGIHTVGFDAEEDAIELTHTAKSRRGFALGAVRAAEWIVGRKGFFSFEDSIQDILAQAR